MDRCESCFREYDGAVCPHCGGAQNEEHQLPVGTMIRERYKLGRVLGQGGFGITYIAWDSLLDKCVAVKEFFPNGTVFRRSEVSTAVECGTKAMIPHYEYSRERFLREARALAKFQDIPEVVGLLDFVKENNTAYIIMEYVRGVDLAKYIQRKGGKLTAQETFRILKPVMEALAKVHKGNIVHRDISPDNIILDPMGGAKLLDFGAVRAVEDPDVDKGLNKSTEAILKQGFAPIEQYNSRGSLGPWTDEYAMCATVWYCLTGKVPEEASIRMGEGIDPDWSTIPGLPEHQQKALEKGFSCRAKDRYESMDELLADLFPEVAEETAISAPVKEKEVPVVIPEETRTVPVKAPKKRGKGLWIAVAAVLVIILAVAIFIPKGAKTGPEEEAYLQAEALLEEGKLGEAAIAFGKLSGFSDALERSFAIWEQITDRDAVSAGAAHTVGLRADGTVVAVGSNNNGQCDVGGWTDVVTIATGNSYTVGLRADGTVVATGSNFNGQCNVSGWTDIVAISTGSYHTAGLKSDGTVVAVGNNDHDKCKVSGWTNIVAISAGAYHTVGLKADGTVVAVGLNSNGQCNVSGWTDIVAISAGADHTVGLKSDGTVVAVGWNTYGQRKVSGWTDVVAISAGLSHTVALRADGTVVAVGYNECGQCDVAGWTGVAAIAAGNSHTVGLRADGTVVAVGYNEYGKCDVSDWTDIRLPYERVPFR